MFKPQNWLDRAFEIGIIGKGINGTAGVHAHAGQLH
jgi:hypothetical protein